jgi:hypothetical protein
MRTKYLTTTQAIRQEEATSANISAFGMAILVALKRQKKKGFF